MGICGLYQFRTWRKAWKRALGFFWKRKLIFNSSKRKITQDPKILFLIDGFGAFITAFLLGLVMTHFQSFIGMPINVLYSLAIVASIFAVYDLACFFWAREYWRIFIKVMAIANLLFCSASIVLVFHFFHIVTALGILYFSLEIGIIVSLAVFELKIAARWY